MALEDDAALEARPGDLAAGHEDVAGARLLEAGEDVEDRRLAAARVADDADELAAADAEVDVLEHRLGAAGVGLGQALDGQEPAGGAVDALVSRHTRPPRCARANSEVERHADHADDQDREDHVREREVVPLVPDEVADAGAADEHLGGDDDQPGDSHRDPHAGEDGRRGRRQDHLERLAQRRHLERARDVEPLAANAGDAEAVLISIGQSEQMKITKMPEIDESLIV